MRRRRDKLFAWMNGCLAAMPVLVILPRSLYAVHVALPAWFLSAACFVTLRTAAGQMSLPPRVTIAHSSGPRKERLGIRYHALGAGVAF